MTPTEPSSTPDQQSGPEQPQQQRAKSPTAKSGPNSFNFQLPAGNPLEPLAEDDSMEFQAIEGVAQRRDNGKAPAATGLSDSQDTVASRVTSAASIPQESDSARLGRSTSSASTNVSEISLPDGDITYPPSDRDGTGEPWATNTLGRQPTARSRLMRTFTAPDISDARPLPSQPTRQLHHHPTFSFENRPTPTISGASTPLHGSPYASLAGTPLIGSPVVTPYGGNTPNDSPRGSRSGSVVEGMAAARIGDDGPVTPAAVRTARYEPYPRASMVRSRSVGSLANNAGDGAASSLSHARSAPVRAESFTDIRHLVVRHEQGARQDLRQHFSADLAGATAGETSASGLHAGWPPGWLTHQPRGHMQEMPVPAPPVAYPQTMHGVEMADMPVPGPPVAYPQTMPGAGMPAYSQTMHGERMPEMPVPGPPVAYPGPMHGEEMQFQQFPQAAGEFQADPSGATGNLMSGYDVDPSWGGHPHVQHELHGATANFPQQSPYPHQEPAPHTQPYRFPSESQFSAPHQFPRGLSPPRYELGPRPTPFPYPPPEPADSYNYPTQQEDQPMPYQPASGSQPAQFNQMGQYDPTFAAQPFTPVAFDTNPIYAPLPGTWDASEARSTTEGLSGSGELDTPRASMYGAPSVSSGHEGEGTDTYRQMAARRPAYRNATGAQQPDYPPPLPREAGEMPRRPAPPPLPRHEAAENPRRSSSHAAPDPLDTRRHFSPSQSPTDSPPADTLPDLPPPSPMGSIQPELTKAQRRRFSNYEVDMNDPELILKHRNLFSIFGPEWFEAVYLLGGELIDVTAVGPEPRCAVHPEGDHGRCTRGLLKNAVGVRSRDVHHTQADTTPSSESQAEINLQSHYILHVKLTETRKKLLAERQASGGQSGPTSAGSSPSGSHDESAAGADPATSPGQGLDGIVGSLSTVGFQTEGAGAEISPGAGGPAPYGAAVGSFPAVGYHTEGAGRAGVNVGAGGPVGYGARGGAPDGGYGPPPGAGFVGAPNLGVPPSFASGGGDVIIGGGGGGYPHPDAGVTGRGGGGYPHPDAGATYRGNPGSLAGPYGGAGPSSFGRLGGGDGFNDGISGGFDYNGIGGEYGRGADGEGPSQFSGGVPGARPGSGFRSGWADDGEGGRTQGGQQGYVSGSGEGGGGTGGGEGR
ncbi:hypothetical protein BDK51DRAFT_42419 [Blyttiomyces helicus]|uniref:Uncharacterized protein n=1 Tax=Blyttiomyces helicus TaxID=388810 RepID=A0A4P9WT36_9FUNG|nr:hypothetical protein BDK51DRAFT_42419 [Blyttiomyces helicus]|eukprot:RKO94490.1 hypothetical protein BDK51DRAFT_42419 [Blyttiomyces helicus]